MHAKVNDCFLTICKYSNLYKFETVEYSLKAAIYRPIYQQGT